jgi:chemotaxis protein methyltransferase CheR
LPDGKDIEAIEVRLFLEAIHDRYGYDLRDYSTPSIRRRLLAALAKTGLAHLGELQHQVLNDPQLFTTVLEDLTVRVSEMFRDPSFYRSFRTQVIPILRTYPLLNVWHSGCASGEEAFSSAIILTEEGLYDRVQIYATDLSDRALEQAKQGLYSAEVIPQCSANYEAAGGTARFADYYRTAYDHFAMRESLRRRILFFQHNLVSDHVFAEMHIIFCRNVLIYFEPALRERVLKKFVESLCPGGFLCLGSSERLAPVYQDVFSTFDDRERIYRFGGLG